MRFFSWLAFFIALVVAVLAIQNSTSPVISVKILAWEAETSPVYAILGSLFAGAFITALLWITYSIRESILRRDLKRQIDILRRLSGSTGSGLETRPEDDGRGDSTPADFSPSPKGLQDIRFSHRE
jgi:uncharacterized integral membrane protein